jgi:hypothetical protein
VTTAEPDPDPDADPLDSRDDSPRHAATSVPKNITASRKCCLGCMRRYRCISRRFRIAERLHTEIAFSKFGVESDPSERE